MGTQLEGVLRRGSPLTAGPIPCVPFIHMPRAGLCVVPILQTAVIAAIGVQYVGSNSSVQGWTQGSVLRIYSPSWVGHLLQGCLPRAFIFHNAREHSCCGIGENWFGFSQVIEDLGQNQCITHPKCVRCFHKHRITESVQ